MAVKGLRSLSVLDFNIPSTVQGHLRMYNTLLKSIRNMCNVGFASLASSDFSCLLITDCFLIFLYIYSAILSFSSRLTALSWHWNFKQLLLPLVLGLKPTTFHHESGALPLSYSGRPIVIVIGVFHMRCLIMNVVYVWILYSTPSSIFKLEVHALEIFHYYYKFY